MYPPNCTRCVRNIRESCVKSQAPFPRCLIIYIMKKGKKLKKGKKSKIQSPPGLSIPQKGFRGWETCFEVSISINSDSGGLWHSVDRTRTPNTLCSSAFWHSDKRPGGSNLLEAEKLCFGSRFQRCSHWFYCLGLWSGSIGVKAVAEQISPHWGRN